MTKGNQLLANATGIFSYLKGDLELDVSDGLCANHDNPDLWFAGEIELAEGEVWTNTKDQKRRFQLEIDKAVSALSVCSNCPAKNNCLQLGLRGIQQASFGIYGGTMPAERLGMLGRLTKQRDVVKKVNFARRVRKTMQERGLHWK